MKKNDIVTLQIEDLNNLGYGVAHINGKTVFISGAVDGDTVKCKIIKDCGTYFIGKAEELITPSEFRIAPEFVDRDHFRQCIRTSEMLVPEISGDAGGRYVQTLRNILHGLLSGELV